MIMSIRQTTFLKHVLGLIKVLCLSWISPLITRTYKLKYYLQSDGSHPLQKGISHAPSILLDCFLVKIIRVLLARLPNRGNLYHLNGTHTCLSPLEQGISIILSYLSNLTFPSASARSTASSINTAIQLLRDLLSDSATISALAFNCSEI